MGRWLSEWASGSVDGLVGKSFGVECNAAQKKAVSGRDIAERSINNPEKPKELYKSSRRKPWLTVYRRRPVFGVVGAFFRISFGNRFGSNIFSS